MKIGIPLIPVLANVHTDFSFSMPFSFSS